MFPALRRLAGTTPIYRWAASRLRTRRMQRRFWDWTPDDQRRSLFYRQFFNPGDLVFDVGANFGNRSKVFLHLGAVVVAVEPQTVCADFLRSVFRQEPSFRLVKTALGDARGEVEMMLSEIAANSSLSREWIQAVTSSGRFSADSWTRSETVPVQTLDDLIAVHGSPAFIKIDVEGFEREVIRGLSVPVRALSFEFTPETIPTTLACIEHLSGLGEACFQVSLGESMAFLADGWMDAPRVCELLTSVPRSEFGDVYAKFALPPR